MELFGIQIKCECGTIFHIDGEAASYDPGKKCPNCGLVITDNVVPKKGGIAIFLGSYTQAPTMRYNWTPYKTLHEHMNRMVEELEQYEATRRKIV